MPKYFAFGRGSSKIGFSHIYTLIDDISFLFPPLLVVLSTCPVWI